MADPLQRRALKTFLSPGPLLEEYGRARFVVLPLPYERTVTFQTGSDRGPRATIEATANLEDHDEELGIETVRWGIHTAPEIRADEDPGAFADRVEAVYRRCLDDGKFVVALGGEHSVSLGPIRALAARHPGLSVLQIDAHADLRDEWEGSRFNHGCVMRRALEHASVVQVGIRSFSAGERGLIGQGAVRTWMARDCRRGFGKVIEGVVEALTGTVYVTIDMDGLDPALVPGTGTPEPGGLDWWQVNDLLDAVSRSRRVVGADVVEIMPVPGQAVSEFVAARLAYRMMGLAAKYGHVEGP